MKQFSLLKSDKENFSYIIDVLKMLLGGHILIKEEENYLLVEHNEVSFDEVDATIKSLENDLNTWISFYQTSTDAPTRELSLLKESFLEANYGHYHLKKFIPCIENRKVKLDIFHFLTEKTGINEEIILAMADSDLNVSKASNLLYMHRNTLMYKIERLDQLKKFDLKKFHDLYLLVYLLKA